MYQVVTVQINTPSISQEQIFSQQHLISTSSVESITQGIASLSLSKQEPPGETQFLGMNNGICIEHVFSYLSCKERSCLGFSCKVLNDIYKSSYKDWVQTIYEANRETGLLGRIGIQVPSSLDEAIVHSELFFENVKVRLEEINRTLPPSIKHEGSIANLLLNQTQTVNFLETLYQYSLVQVFGEVASVADAMPLKQKAEHILVWLNTPEQVSTVTSLWLPAKNLFCVPQEICKLTHLTELEMPRNQITSLPQGIGALTNLSFLVVYGNRLTSLLREICALTNLAGLDVSENQFTSLPQEIGSLPKLKSFYLDQATADKSLSEIETMKRRGVMVILR